MPPGIDLWTHAVAADERVVRRHAAVVRQTQQLTDMRAEILRPGIARLAGAADRHEQRAVVGEEDPRCAAAPFIEAVRDEDVLDVGDRKSTRLNSSHVKISYAVFCL